MSITTCPCRAPRGFAEGEDLSGVIECDGDGAKQALVTGEAIDGYAFTDLGGKAQTGDKILAAQLHTYDLSVIGLDG